MGGVSAAPKLAHAYYSSARQAEDLVLRAGGDSEQSIPLKDVQKLWYWNRGNNAGKGALFGFTIVYVPVVGFFKAISSFTPGISGAQIILIPALVAGVIGAVPGAIIGGAIPNSKSQNWELYYKR